MITVLAIDQGTSGTKAVVVSRDNKIIGISEKSITPKYSNGGLVEQDPQEMLDSVIFTAKEAVKEAGVLPDIITLANQGETVLAWDKDTGEPLSPMLVWQDRRAEKICHRLSNVRDDIISRTGLELDSYFSAPKMTWIRENITREGVISTSDTWLLHKLTGAFVTDTTTASRSLIVNIKTGDWDAVLLEYFGLQNEQLPVIVDSTTIIGNTNILGKNIPVGGIVVDQQAALIAENCLEAGEMKCTFGTGAFLLANIGKEARLSKSGLTTSIAYTVNNEHSYCLDGQIYTAASAIRWLIQLGLLSTANEIDSVAAESTNGVISVPSLAGLAAPWWQSEAKASINGLSLSSKPGHIVLAVLEGIAAQLADIKTAINSDFSANITSLKVDGGLSQSKVLMQAVSNIAQVEVSVYPSQHATPLGAAALARCAFLSDIKLKKAIIPWEPEAVFKPIWSKQQSNNFLKTWHTHAKFQADLTRSI